MWPCAWATWTRCSSTPWATPTTGCARRRWASRSTWVQASPGTARATRPRAPTTTRPCRCPRAGGSSSGARDCPCAPGCTSPSATAACCGRFISPGPTRSCWRRACRFAQGPGPSVPRRRGDSERSATIDNTRRSLMCGIFGYVGRIERAAAERCLHTLAHRGPDGWGVWSDEHVTLGHRRLAILDLSENGAQPMSYAGERYWITFNGEIYNFLELRAELEGRGHVFRTKSDTEVILAAYLQWGEDCQVRFNGMWAFAIWDSVARRLFLSRDRFGKKPLFYAQLPGGDFVFASEMKALLPLLPSFEPDRSLIKGMTLRSSFAYEATERCLIKGIKRFPAGHCAA